MVLLNKIAKTIFELSSPLYTRLVQNVRAAVTCQLLKCRIFSFAFLFLIIIDTAPWQVKDILNTLYLKCYVQ